MLKQPDLCWMTYIWYLSIQKYVRNRRHRFTRTSIQRVNFNKKREQVHFLAQYNCAECFGGLQTEASATGKKGKVGTTASSLNSKGDTYAKKVSEILVCQEYHSIRNHNMNTCYHYETETDLI